MKGAAGKTIGATAGFRPWTSAEDAAIRDRYVSDGAPALAKEMGRTFSAVCHRAARLGIQSKRRWTPADDIALELAWGDRSVGEISKLLGRTALTVYWRAEKLGLDLGCPQGFEYLTDAGVRAGFSTETLRKILRWAGVKIRVSVSRPVKRRHFHIVETDSVDAAVKRWMATETIEAAARSRGTTREILNARLLASGERLPPKPRGKRHWRIETALIDRVLAKFAGLETVHAAAKRTGLCRNTLTARLRQNGVQKATTGKLWWVERAVVDRIAEAT